jgi:glycosyltransferase involved in cell wall biosynthesis
MKIIVDLQSPQGLSKNRGMGRYSLSLAQGMLRLATGHEIWIALNGLFPDTIDSLRKVFEGLLPPDRIVVWQAPGPVAFHDPANMWRREAAEYLREFFLNGLRPDIVYVSSLFEGYADNCVTSVGKASRANLTAVTIYDLIPLIFEHIYLQGPQMRAWYYQKLQWLKNADLWLAISEHTRQDAIERLGLPDDRVVNISGGVDPQFRETEIDPTTEASLRSRYKLSRAFLVYTGGIDPRKNVEGLIKAFALLPRGLRKNYQLAIVCDIQEHERRRLAELVRHEGLRPDDVVFTGFVPDEDLVTLYNLCTLFIFPSLYEGFGLPPLEAMACGAPVIASNSSSLPEVIGWEKALFDPQRPEAIAEKIHEALTDEAFRDGLRKHGLEQAKRFSWEESARRALAAFEALCAEKSKEKSYPVVLRSLKPRLAYFSPLPPARSGIADYSRELLPELARYYQIELIIDQQEVSDPWLLASFPIRSVEWFEKHADRYDRILYHFGNSEFHKHMFNLLRKHPGIVVLHDFYLSGVLNWMDFTGYAPGIFQRELYRSHGYNALAELVEKGREAVIWKYPCNLSVLEGADGIIVHSRHAMELADEWYGKGTSQNWRVIPHLRNLPFTLNRSSARMKLGLGNSDFLVCSFGFLGPTNLPEVILDGWLSSKLARNPRSYLVFVGSSFDQELEAKLKERAKQSGVADRVRITGYVSREIYECYLSAADAVIQLRTRSRGETSGPVLDSLAWGLPTVVNAHGWMAELPDGVVMKLPDDVQPRHVARALEELHDHPDFRQHLGEAGRAYIQENHAPHKIARSYFEAIEDFAHSGRHTRRRRLIQAIAQIDATNKPVDQDLVMVAKAIVADQERGTNVRQILVDVSQLYRQDLKTGIPRVVRAVLKHLLGGLCNGWKVEPVYAEPGSVYRYARTFMRDYFRLPSPNLPDDVVETNSGDVFLGLDWAPLFVPDQMDFFKQVKRQNVPMYFVLYDLLPVWHPEWFVPEICTLFTRWFYTITHIADGIVCISRSVADQLVQWLETAKPLRVWPLKIGYFHLGADAESASPPGDDIVDPEILGTLARGMPVFLMVGTVEPRKGYAQALEAFEILWQSGIDVSLIIVGKQGKMVEPLVEQLRNHPEQGRRLFWLDKASDALLLELYKKSTALLMASEGEGFGLPLIEAARHGLPIIARDIPVFREVCGEHAFYFEGNKPEDLANAIITWLNLYQAGKAPSVEGMRVLTWKESTQQLLDVILGGNWYKVWKPK